MSQQYFTPAPGVRATQIALGDLAIRTTPIPGTMTCAEVERVLARDEGPRPWSRSARTAVHCSSSASRS